MVEATHDLDILGGGAVVATCVADLPVWLSVGFASTATVLTMTAYCTATPMMPFGTYTHDVQIESEDIFNVPYVVRVEFTLLPRWVDDAGASGDEWATATLAPGTVWEAA